MKEDESLWLGKRSMGGLSKRLYANIDWPELATPLAKDVLQLVSRRLLDTLADRDGPISRPITFVAGT